MVFLLLFVHVLGSGLDGPWGGRDTYVNYVVPGVILMTAATAAQGTAISVAIDMTEGIVARFRAMAITRASVLTGRVLGSLAQTLLSMAIVTGVALRVGFEPTADFGEWLGVIGVLVLIIFALTWLSVAPAMMAQSVAAASNMPTPLMILPMMGGGFVSLPPTRCPPGSKSSAARKGGFLASQAELAVAGAGGDAHRLRAMAGDTKLPTTPPAPSSTPSGKPGMLSASVVVVSEPPTTEPPGTAKAWARAVCPAGPAPMMTTSCIPLTPSPPASPGRSRRSGPRPRS
ncbi:ABC transporter permease [Streptomyces sp. NPDC016469]|uniref:ABC transporter permease n=1 Tax=Streptomyces sp. NPDC016469 TaxID=3157191 RepID=UPI0034010653